MDAGALTRVDSLVRAAVSDSVAPGAAVAVGRSGGLARLSGYGRLDWDPASPPVTDSTLYDLASLTKVVGTTSALMELVEEGRVELEAPVSRYLPWFAGGGKGEVTVRQLLRHRGGLPPFRDWWKERSGRDAYRQAIADLPLARPPGDSTVYSDIGFMTLGFLVEEVGGKGLDRFLEGRIFAPLGMGDTGFRPDASLLSRIAPTEVDTLFRHEHVRGSVHDENAHAMGGVAGHAGLFSSARDLAVYARLLLHGGWGPRADRGGEDPAPLVRLFERRTVEAFTARPTPAAGRALGWDVPDPGRGPAGRPEGESPGPGWLGHGSGRAFGHTGFTGTSLWVDPERDVFVVLLTNRVNPTREESGHVRLRRRVHRAVAEAMR